MNNVGFTSCQFWASVFTYISQIAFKCPSKDTSFGTAWVGQAPKHLMAQRHSLNFSAIGKKASGDKVDKK